MGGGPSIEQRNAASAQAQASQEATDIARMRDAREREQYAAIKPYAMDRLNNGLPFYGALTDFSSGTNARAFAPAKANIVRMISRNGSAMPSGYGQQMLADFEANRARGFDQSLVSNELMNEQAKSEAARLLTGQQQIANPLGAYQTAMQGNQSIMNAPLASPGIGGLLGGIAGGAMSAIPF